MIGGCGRRCEEAVGVFFALFMLLRGVRVPRDRGRPRAEVTGDVLNAGGEEEENNGDGRGELPYFGCYEEGRLLPYFYHRMGESTEGS